MILIVVQMFFFFIVFKTAMSFLLVKTFEKVNFFSLCEPKLLNKMQFKGIC